MRPTSWLPTEAPPAGNERSSAQQRPRGPPACGLSVAPLFPAGAASAEGDLVGRMAVGSNLRGSAFSGGGCRQTEHGGGGEFGEVGAVDEEFGGSDAAADDDQAGVGDGLVDEDGPV